MKLIDKILGKKSVSEGKEPQSLPREEKQIYKIGREQLLKLKEKGLQIPVFTL